MGWEWGFERNSVVGRYAFTMKAFAAAVIALAVVAVCGLMGYQIARDRLAAGVYRDRLQTLHRDYNQLAEQYNDAVTRNAVTELLVRDGALSVSVRTPAGVLETVPVPWKPGSELYVDYLVLDGRLWIRRVYDATTPPESGTVINPALLDPNWQSQNPPEGKAVYRKLTDGRWIVTATENGSLGLRKIDDNTDVTLLTTPAIRDFDPVQQAQQDIDKITTADVLEHLTSR